MTSPLTAARGGLLALPLLLLAPAVAAAAGLPTSFTAGGVEYGAKGTVQYDVNRFADDAGAFEDADDWRRQELYLFARRKGSFELTAGYDFQAEAWADVFLKLETAAGDFRAGQQKTLVGWEDYATGTSSTLYLERSAAENAFYQGRRVGLEWTWTELENWRFALAGYTGPDLEDENDGTTVAGRVVHTPIADDTRVLHLGASASRERRDDGIARFRARPNAALTDVRLVDTGRLASDSIDRLGLEAAWRDGPLLLCRPNCCTATTTPRPGSRTSPAAAGTRWPPGCSPARPARTPTPPSATPSPRATPARSTCSCATPTWTWTTARSAAAASATGPWAPTGTGAST